MKRRIRLIFSGIIMLTALWLTSCVSTLKSFQADMMSNTLVTSSHTAGPGDASSALVELRMGGGVLNVTSGTDTLIEAQLAASNDDWLPRSIQYDVEDARGHAIIEQPQTVNFGTLSDYEYRWDVTLNETIPLDLVVELGAGRSDIDLSRVALSSLAVKAGAGQSTIDLSGSYGQDVDAEISGGVGDLTVYLPQDMGVVVEVEGGLGAVEAVGLQRDGTQFVNDGYDQIDATLSLSITGGIGNITLEVIE